MRCRRNEHFRCGLSSIHFEPPRGAKGVPVGGTTRGLRGDRHTRSKAPRDNSIIMSAFVYFAHRLQCRSASQADRFRGFGHYGYFGHFQRWRGHQCGWGRGVSQRVRYWCIRHGPNSCGIYKLH